MKTGAAVTFHWTCTASTADTKVTDQQNWQEQNNASLPYWKTVMITLSTLETWFHYRWESAQHISLLDIYSSNISLLPSVQFSSRWYLCTRKSPYASHPVSQSAVYCDTLHIANALMAQWEPTWPACKIRFQPTLTSRHSAHLTVLKHSSNQCDTYIL